MGWFGSDDEEKPGPGPLGAWGTKAMGMDEMFSRRGQNYQGANLGMGGTRPKSMGPMITRRPLPNLPNTMSRLPQKPKGPNYGKMLRAPSLAQTPNPSPINKQARKTLAQLEAEKKTRAEGRAATAEYVNVGANLGMGFANAKSNKEREAVAQQAAIYGATKSLEFGAEKLYDFFNPEDASEGIKAVASDHTAGLLEEAANVAGDPSVIEGADAVAADTLDNLGDLPGASETTGAIQVGADIAGGDSPLASVLEERVQAGGTAAGAAAGTAVLPGAGTAIGAMLGSKAGKMAGQKLSEIAKLRKNRTGLRSGAVQNPGMYGGVSDYLFS